MRYEEMSASEKEAYNDQTRSWYRENSDRHREISRAWMVRHPEKGREYTRRWRERNPEKALSSWNRRRARKKNAPVIEKIDRAYIYERDGGRCHFCGTKVSRTNFHLDHLVPLSWNGEETHANMRVSCPACNLKSGPGRLPAQLLLVA